MRIKDFTITQLLAIILISGLVIVSLAMVFNIMRMNARDMTRLGDIATIKSALTAYYKNSAIGYPVSTGECLNDRAGVGAELEAAKALLSLPIDPLWPVKAPSKVISGVPDAGQVNFCYFYFSDISDQFKISFFLESNSKAGRAGINTATQ